MKMISIKLILIASLAANLATTIQAAANYNGCAVIHQDGTCAECFQRKLLLNGAGCGPILPKSDPCLLYQTGFENNKQVTMCSTCKTGYASRININGAKILQECVKASLSNCLLENDAAFPKFTQKTCIACPSGQYSVRNRTTRTANCQKIERPVAHCKWGSIFSEALNRASCIRCDDGYAVNAKTKQCHKAVGVGCWVQQRGKCIACNPFEGYSINAKGGCFRTKASSIVKD